MKDQSISVQQMQETAGRLKIGECEYLYVPDIDQLVIIVRESDAKVNKLKSKESVMVEATYLPEYNSIAIAIHLDINNREMSIIAPSTIHENLVNYLEKVTTNNNSIQITVVGNDLNNISSRHYFMSELSKASIKRELNKIKSHN